MRPAFRPRAGSGDLLGFFFTVLYMVMIYLRPQEFIPAIKGFPLVDVVAAMCMAAVFLEGSFSAEKFKRSAVNYLVIFFWLATIMSHIGNFYLGGAINAFTKIGSNVVFAYYLVMLTVDNFKRLKLFIWIMILLTLLQAVQAIMQYYTGSGLVGGETLARRDLTGEKDYIIQAQGIGIFADPNDLALTIVTFLPFFLPYIHKPFLSPSMFTGILLMLPAITVSSLPAAGEGYWAWALCSGFISTAGWAPWFPSDSYFFWPPFC